MDYQKFKDWLNPSENPDIEPAFKYQTQHLPTFWLLGKTGAGKSSLVKAVTQNTVVEIGNGFRPCTQTADSYDYPQQHPLIRFLDTKGLGEADYDPSEDIAQCQDRSHALILVAKVEEPEQSAVLEALKHIKNSGKIKQIMVVHTGLFLVENPEQHVLYNQNQFETAWGSKLPSVSVDFELDNGGTFGIESLKTQLAELLPILAMLSHEEGHKDNEEKNFNLLKKEILWYSGSAATADVLPAVGLVAVPAIQGKMLHSLANQYGITWDKKALSEFLGVLDTSFGVQYVSKLGLRQLVKFIPVYGQVVGSATAATISFCTTYAVGRVACKYMYHKSKGEPISEDVLKQTYEKAFEQIKGLAKHENST